MSYQWKNYPPSSLAQQLNYWWNCRWGQAPVFMLNRRNYWITILNGERLSPNINESMSKSCPAFIRLVAVVVDIHLGEKEVRGVTGSNSHLVSGWWWWQDWQYNINWADTVSVDLIECCFAKRQTTRVDRVECPLRASGEPVKRHTLCPTTCLQLDRWHY